MKYDQNGISKELKPVADREERSAMHVHNTKEKIVLVSNIDKENLVRQKQLYGQPCVIMPKSRKTSKRNPKI